jgi:hypothetical protein
VTVQDINDNSPRFNRSSFPLEISEAVTLGASFTLEGAVDDDTGTNNSVQNYYLKPSGGPFAITFTRRLDNTSDVSLKVGTLVFLFFYSYYLIFHRLSSL